MPVRENKLEVVPYDSDWPAAFEAEAIHLRTALGSLALRIVSSALAVPKMPVAPGPHGLYGKRRRPGSCT